MRTFTRALTSLAAAAAIALSPLATANAFSSLSSSSSPSVPSIPTPPADTDTPSPDTDTPPVFWLSQTERDFLETSMELNFERYYLRGGGMPKVTNDNLAVEASRNVADLDYSGDEEVWSHASYSTEDRVVIVERWDLATAYFDRGDSLEDTVAPDRSGLNYGTHVISDDDYLYVITVWTVSPFRF